MESFIQLTDAEANEPTSQRTAGVSQGSNKALYHSQIANGILQLKEKILGISILQQERLSKTD